MLTFEEKAAIIESFPELEKKAVSLGRVNYQFAGSVTDKKNVVYHLHPNGNGFVYTGNLAGYQADEKGLVNIKNFSGPELKDIVAKSIALLSRKTAEPEQKTGVPGREVWVGSGNALLEVIEEDDLWNIYYGANLEESFETYSEVEEYMTEEGFRKQ